MTLHTPQHCGPVRGNFASKSYLRHASHNSLQPRFAFSQTYANKSTSHSVLPSLLLAVCSTWASVRHASATPNRQCCGAWDHPLKRRSGSWRWWTVGPNRLEARTTRCGRVNPGSIPGSDSFCNSVLHNIDVRRKAPGYSLTYTPVAVKYRNTRRRRGFSESQLYNAPL